MACSTTIRHAHAVGLALGRLGRRICAQDNPIAPGRVTGRNKWRRKVEINGGAVSTRAKHQAPSDGLANRAFVEERLLIHQAGHQVERAEVLADGQALIEGFVDREVQSATQVGVADREQGRQRLTVHLVTEQQAQLFEHSLGEQVRLVKDDARPAAFLAGPLGVGQPGAHHGVALPQRVDVLALKAPVGPGRLG